MLPVRAVTTTDRIQRPSPLRNTARQRQRWTRGWGIQVSSIKPEARADRRLRLGYRRPRAPGGGDGAISDARVAKAARPSRRRDGRPLLGLRLGSPALIVVRFGAVTACHAAIRRIKRRV